jgi:hypothetical protein
MSNEQFNSLTSADVNAICQEHSQAVLNQLHSQLPTYTAFMSELIEKTVEIEKMKANRTPSAWAEAIQAFLAGLDGSDLGTIGGLEQYNNTEGLPALATISPLLGLMALLAGSGTGGGGTDPEPTASNTHKDSRLVWVSEPNNIVGTQYYRVATFEFIATPEKTEQLKTTFMGIMTTELDYSPYTQGTPEQMQRHLNYKTAWRKWIIVNQWQLDNGVSTATPQTQWPVAPASDLYQPHDTVDTYP